VLARHWRARFRPALIAVAGSNGKTTVKEMLASILRFNAGDEAVLATAGNLNKRHRRPLSRCCACGKGTAGARSSSA
jgi:UDP-N-acetylmuramoyl-tripeptide--D-alanyl-D-alanine ligase